MDYEKTLFPACVTDGEGSLYYVTHVERIIKKLDLESYELEYIDTPKEYDLANWEGVDKLLIDNNKLYLFEESGKRILEYDLLSKISRCFEVKCNNHVCDNWAACTIYNNKLFIFPSFANKCIKVDLVQGKVEKGKELYPNLEFVYNQKKYFYSLNEIKIEVPHKLFSCSYQLEHEIWLFTEREQIVLRYDLCTGKYMEYALPKEIKGCVHAIWKNGIFYILSLEGNVYSWDFLSDKVQILSFAGDTCHYPCFGKLMVTDKNIWIIPCFGKEIYIVDIEKNKTSVYSAYPEDFYYYKDLHRSKFYGYGEDVKNYYFAMHSANYMLVVEKSSGKETWLRPTEPDFIKRVNYYKKNQRQYYESDLGIKGLLLMIKDGVDMFDKIGKIGVGKSVWNKMKEEVKK